MSKKTPQRTAKKAARRPAPPARRRPLALPAPKAEDASGAPVRVEIVQAAAPPPVAQSDVDPLARALTTEAVYVGGHGLSAQRFTPEETAALLQPASPETELDVLPTGETYMSGVHVRRRLFAAFGPGGWGMRPLSMPKLQGDTVTQLWELVVHGRSVAQAWGECEYRESNERMSYPTALEAAKTNALSRCAKDIGIASECWDRRFSDAYRARHCVRVHRHAAKRDPWQWRRVDATPWWDEDGLDADTPADLAARWHQQRRELGRADRAAERVDDRRDYSRGAESHAPSAPPPSRQTAPPSPHAHVGDAARDERVISEPQRKRLWAIMQTHGASRDDVDAHLALRYPYTVDPEKRRPTSARLRRSDYDAVVQWVQSGGRG